MRISPASSISYGIGGAAYAVKEAAFGTFVLLFYTQVLGLSGIATGIVLFISLLWDAVSDPMMGAWSDRFKSRWGRRLPFMVVSALPLALGFVALFWPPSWVRSDMGLLAGWLLACSLWIRTWVTVFALPHIAMAAEVTQDYHERSRLLGLRTGFLFFTAIAISAIGMFFILGETDGVDGRFIAENYIDFGWLAAVVVIITAAITIWGTRGFVEATRIEPEKMPSGAGLRGVVTDFLSTLRISNFRNLLFYDLAASSSYGIAQTLNMMIWTYYWELGATEIAMVLAVPAFIAVPAALITLGTLGKKWPKHTILRTALILMILDVIWIYIPAMLGLLPENGHVLNVSLLLLQNFLFIYFFVMRSVSGSSITADITDENEARSGKRQEAGLYSVTAFTTKLASAAGPLYAGLALDVIGLTEGMLPGTIDQPVLNNLIWATGVGVIPLMLVAWYFTRKVSMSEEQLLEIQQRIRAREAHAEN